MCVTLRYLCTVAFGLIAVFFAAARAPPASAASDWPTRSVKFILTLGRGVGTAAILAVAAIALSLLSQSVRAEQPRPLPKLVSLSSLIAQGFEIKGLTGNQSGVVSTLVLQKDKDIYLCGSKDFSIQPTAFECWPVQ